MRESVAPAGVVLTPEVPVPLNPKIFGIGDDWVQMPHSRVWPRPYLPTNLPVAWDHSGYSFAVQAIRSGQTRFPGGASSNYWNISGASAVMPCADAQCAKKGDHTCDVQHEVDEYTRRGMLGALSLLNFTQHISAHNSVPLPILDLNLFSMTSEQTSSTVRYIKTALSEINGGKQGPLMIELGKCSLIPNHHDSLALGPTRK